jgi:hypothetical protein
MVWPVVTELPRPSEPVVADPFIQDLDGVPARRIAVVASRSGIVRIGLPCAAAPPRA